MNKHNYISFIGFIVVMALLVSANCCPGKKHDSGKMGFALAIGLNELDPSHYGSKYSLSGCENDANDLAAIAAAQGFTVETLITKKATRKRLHQRLECLSEQMKSGDLLVISYSGHGGQVSDENGDEVDDGLDETWCLYDGEFLDDELFELWTKFQPGVRILVFSDSCHSGTVLRMIKADLEKKDTRSMAVFDEKWQELIKKPINRSSPSREVDMNRISIPRSIPPGVSARIYNDHKSFYDKIGRAAPKEDSTLLKASIILISGCKDEQLSLDGSKNGLFTEKLLGVWQNGSFQGDHLKFHEEIKSRVESASDYEQSPYLFTLGASKDFLKQHPYEIE